MPLQSQSADAPKVLSDVLIHELSTLYSREGITLSAQSADLPLGTVMALAADEWQPLTTGLADVDKVAVLISQVAVSTTAQKAAVIVRGAVVSTAGLVWSAGLSDTEKKTALDKFDTQGVAARS